MKAYYNNFLEKSPQGAVFRARTEHAVITAYRSEKVFFQGGNIDTEINKWKNNHAILKNNSTYRKKKKNNGSYIPQTSILLGKHIDSDESGTDDYLGPVTTAALDIR